uniref:Uncharacterized protein n=1 Tax=Plectus sambesii TaxID=2011161 RepID=A0A914VBU0_9BILA
MYLLLQDALTDKFVNKGHASLRTAYACSSQATFKHPSSKYVLTMEVAFDNVYSADDVMEIVQTQQLMRAVRIEATDDIHSFLVDTAPETLEETLSLVNRFEI